MFEVNNISGMSGRAYVLERQGPCERKLGYLLIVLGCKLYHRSSRDFLFSGQSFNLFFTKFVVELHLS